MEFLIHEIHILTTVSTKQQGFYGKFCIEMDYRILGEVYFAVDLAYLIFNDKISVTSDFLLGEIGIYG
jgi:hypothetical protein